MKDLRPQRGRRLQPRSSHAAPRVALRPLRRPGARSRRLLWVGVLAALLLLSLSGLRAELLGGPAPAAAAGHGTSEAVGTNHGSPAAEQAGGAHETAGGEAGTSEEHGEEALTFSFSKELMRFINFLVLVVVLVIVLRKPLSSALTNRTEGIARKLQEAEEARQQAVAKQREYEAKLANLEEEVRGIREEAQREAEAQRQQVAVEGEAMVQRVLEQARRGIEIERLRAIESLRNEAANLALEHAADRLAQNLTPEDQQRLVDEYVRQVGEVW